MTVIYKIATGCIAERIKRFLNEIISNDQTGFIKGRFMGENIRLVYDIMSYTKIKQLPGLVMLIDFEKAFDSLSWNFIFECLNFFNFGKAIQQWIEVFYKNISSCIIQNGIVSE